MTRLAREVVYDGGQLFRVEHQEVEGRELPYEFVSRIGAVTILPIIHERPHDPQALVIRNKRLYYGSSDGLPGGNLDGGFENPEHPTATAERELREETGYGYRRSSDRNISTFALRKLSSTVLYTRYFAVMRGVTHVGGEDNNPHEVVTLQPMPVYEYVDPLFKLRRGEMYPEVNAAFAKANMELGRDAVMGWLLGDDTPGASEVPEAFEPWLLPVVA